MVAEHYKRIRHDFFDLKAAQKVVALHLKRDFDIIFLFKVAQNFVAEQYARDFDMIFHVKAAQNLVVKHYERFWHDFPLYGSSKLGCKALWKRFLNYFPF